MGTELLTTPSDGDNPRTMSSREIADLVGSRHDKVKQSIVRLAERGVIDLPPLGEYLDTLGRSAEEYRVGKRDSYVIVAQLSPEFTARLVDRWEELERERLAAPAFDPHAMLNDPAAMRGILLTYTEKVIELEAKVAESEETVTAFNRIASADGSTCVTDAAKTLQMRPKDLFSYLRLHGWIYRRAGTSTDLGYQSKVNSGLLEHKVTVVTRADGSEKETVQVRITARGLAVLAKVIQPAAQAA